MVASTCLEVCCTWYSTAPPEVWWISVQPIAVLMTIHIIIWRIYITKRFNKWISRCRKICKYIVRKMTRDIYTRSHESTKSYPNYLLCPQTAPCLHQLYHLTPCFTTCNQIINYIWPPNDSKQQQAGHIVTANSIAVIPTNSIAVI